MSGCHGAYRPKEPAAWASSAATGIKDASDRPLVKLPVPNREAIGYTTRLSRECPILPAVEPLDRRVLLSATLSDDGTLTVLGDTGANVIRVDPVGEGAGSVVRATVDGAAQEFPASGVRRIYVEGGARDDSIAVRVSVPVSLYGGAGSDVIDATYAGGGVMAGGSGEDSIYGSLQADVLFGGPGDDLLFGQAGEDSLAGEGGADTMSGGDGADFVTYIKAKVGVTITPGDAGANDGAAGEGDRIEGDVENLVGSEFADTIVTTPDANVVYAYGGNDTVTGVGAGDAIYGLDGDDVLSIDAAAGPGSTLFGGAGNDRLIGGESADVLLGEAGNDTLNGNGGNDLLLGDSNGVNPGDGNDSLDGGAGDDNLFGGGGSDVFTGGAGLDTANYSFRTAGVSVRVDALANDGEPGEGDQVQTDVETIYGGSGPDLLVGGSAANLLVGLAGDDTLQGGAGDDTLDGGSGADDLSGGTGVDLADYSRRTENLSLGLGDQADDGAAGEGDNLRDDIERVAGGSGDDVINGSRGSDTLDGGPGNDTIYGKAGDDLLVGGEGSDFLSGGDGNDTIDGGSGDDTLDGGLGTDLLDGGPGANVLNDPPEPNPTPDPTPDPDPVPPTPDPDPTPPPPAPSFAAIDGNGVLTVAGTAAGETLDVSTDGTTVTATRGSEQLSFDAAAVSALRLNGAGGNDRLINETALPATLDGGAGDDTLLGGVASDRLVGGDGVDTVDYSARAVDLELSPDGTPNDGASGEGDNIAEDVENLVGGSGSDFIFGTAGPNRIDAGPGEDTVDGLGGGDTILGGGGGDTFFAANGSPDTLDGGAGADSAQVDAGLDVVANVETVG